MRFHLFRSKLFQVPPRVSPQMVQQISLDAQLETVNSSFADFAHFPESIAEVSPNSFTHMMQNILKPISRSNRYRKINQNHWQRRQYYRMVVKIAYHSRDVHRFHHFNHHNDRVHSKCIESQRPVNPYHHPNR